jgi:hypothetical protein
MTGEPMARARSLTEFQRAFLGQRNKPFQPGAAQVPRLVIVDVDYTSRCKDRIAMRYSNYEYLY